MGYGVTLFFYLLVGSSIGIALWMSRPGVMSHPGEMSFGGGHGFEIWFPVVTAPLFWPLYLPLLLVNRSLATPDRRISPKRNSRDAMSQFINQVERELDRAMQSLHGWAEDLFSSEQPRIMELKTTLRNQADRIRELNDLLTTNSIGVTSISFTDPETSTVSNTAETTSVQGSDSQQHRWASREKTRLENIGQLRQVRDQLDEDLMTTLAWVRELVTMIHLAKYTGAPASRAAEILRQIGAATESLSAPLNRLKIPQPTETAEKSVLVKS